jgi:hypothetical protein
MSSKIGLFASPPFGVGDKNNPLPDLTLNNLEKTLCQDFCKESS